MKDDATRGRHDQWEGRYRAGLTRWDRGSVCPALIQWLASGTLSPGRILVPGCGRGYEVACLADRGFRVTAVDIAPSAVQTLKGLLAARGLAAKAFVADLFDWEPGEVFDAVYEQTCLCAFPPDLWDDYAAGLARWLKPGGTLCALFMQTGAAGGPPYHCEVAEMQSLFSAKHWIWSETEPLRVPHPTGLHEVGYVLRRRVTGTGDA